MAKRFECPRCGSGIKPNDTQCSRCGESLVETEPIQKHEPVPSAQATGTIPAAKKTSSAAVKELVFESESPARKPAAADKDLDRKEKELAEREKAVVASVEQLEKDTKALEDEIKRFEGEDQEMRERERLLKQRETEIEELAAKMESAVASAESGVSGNLERLRELSEDYATKANEARKRQKAELDREIDERVERLRTMQALIASASGLKAVKTVQANITEAAAEPQTGLTEDEIADVIAAVNEELSPQLSAGLPEPGLEVVPLDDERLDRILGGGLPVGYVIIVNGAAGTMKSTLCFSMLHSLASRSGKRSMYFSLEQKRDSIIRQMGRMGMDIDAT
ncbi:MAG TPA: ATPase domain-containing protein, partial [Methanomassiliicoccales archaeon]|nr:ATPase domain-containing protein [Methanomassiliicoccales archaeon]